MFFVLAMLSWGVPDRQTSLDDAFITYRYADNLAAGEGFVFNLGDDPVQGTSTPLYTMLLAVGGLLALDLPILSLVIGTAATATASVLLAVLGKQLGFLGAGLAAGLIWAANPFTFYYFRGMETPLYIAIILAAFVGSLARRPAIAYFLAAMAVLMRIDGLAVMAAVAGYQILSDRRLPALKTILPGLVILVLWFAFAIVTFGEPIPQSALAKIGQDERISGAFNLQSDPLINLIMPLLALLSASSWLNLLTVLVLAILILRVGLDEVKARPLVAWLILYVSAYLLIGLPNFSWYYGPPAAVALLLLCVMLERGVRLLRRESAYAIVCAFGATIAVFLVLSPPPSGSTTRFAGYWEAGEWLKTNAPAGSTVVAYEVGVLSYVSGLNVIDILGLTEPEARSHVAQGDFAWAIRERQPDYVFIHAPSRTRPRWVVTDTIYREPGFETAYRQVQQFDVGQYPHYILFERRQ